MYITKKNTQKRFIFAAVVAAVVMAIMVLKVQLRRH
jgi:hypothetical protein